MSELVSVVIPAYKAEDFIEETVESVRAQTWRPVEVIVVDDHSPDGTADLVERMARTLSTDGFAVRLVRRERNGGVTEALKSGFALADGEYLCWLSADDLYVDPLKLEKQVARLRAGADLVYAIGFLEGPDVESAVPLEGHWSYWLSGPLDRAFNARRLWMALGFMFGNPINGSTVMMRRGLMERYGGFDRFDEVSQNLDSDADLWMRLGALGVSFATVDGVSVLYRKHAGQVSHGRTKEWERDCEIVRARVLLAFDDLGAMGRLLNGAWPVLVFALRGRYRTFPNVARAVCEMGERAGVGVLPRMLCRRLERQLRRESLWDDAAYSDVMAAARAAMGSVEFKAFIARLEASLA